MPVKTLYNDDCLNVLKEMPFYAIDLCVTSPPYDNLRDYASLDFSKFKVIVRELYRVMKQGGVVVWVVSDAVLNGSETGTSFRQALFFLEIGFNLHDTEIYRKKNYMPQNNNRYEQEFEYMFVFSKGKPKTFNPIMIPCKYAGEQTYGVPSYYKVSAKGYVQEGNKRIIKDTKMHGNIFEYRVGENKTGHPAPFPYDLAVDNVLSWSNEGDTVLDIFMGSGTTGIAALKNNRDFIGIELDTNYFELSKGRLENV